MMPSVMLPEFLPLEETPPMIRASRVLLLLVGLVVSASVSGGQDTPPSNLKSESFDKDPGWEGSNNRMVPAKPATATQDFGYSPTRFAGKGQGEIGGRITRTAKPAFYAAKVAKTLNDKLHASGTFAMTASGSGSGFFFGWFNATQQEGCGRPMHSLGLQIDGENSGGRLAVLVINGSNKTCGKFITPFVPGKHRPTPIRNDGTRYTWNLTYDPDANQGKGRVQCKVWGNRALAEEFETQTFTVDLPDGFRKDGAVFDRFGMMNLMKPGGSLTIYFDDLQYDGRTEDFTNDPGWVGSNNRATYADLQVGAHTFGFSARTNFAGGRAGEVGGDLWRSGKYGYYADRIGPLSLDDRLEARGKVVLQVGAPDSDMFIGWFNSTATDTPATTGHFLGVHVGGPTRIGHYFHPAFATAKGTRGMAEGGPVLGPGKVYDWSLVYDPTAANGRGAIRVTLGTESVTLELKQGQKAEGGRFDRFGLFTSTAGGQLVRIYLDDLKYTVTRP
jgi:hypothetical protein